MAALPADFPRDITLAQADTATWRTVYGRALLLAANQTSKRIGGAPAWWTRALRHPELAVIARTLALGPAHVDAPALAMCRQTLIEALRENAEPPLQGHPVHPEFPQAVLALHDRNPLPIFTSHPKLHGTQLGLGDQPLEAWQVSIGAALTTIARHLPLLADEMRLLPLVFYPVGCDNEEHHSGSYWHHLGAIYLTLHPQPQTMAEALIHEFQHSKLHALLHLDPLIRNGAPAMYVSPVRPDLRPLHGLLLAAHAFLPVAELYRRLFAAADPLVQSAWWRQRYAQIGEVNAATLQTLVANADCTPTGANVLRELRGLAANFP